MKRLPPFPAMQPPCVDPFTLLTTSQALRDVKTKQAALGDALLLAGESPAIDVTFATVAGGYFLHGGVLLADVGVMAQHPLPPRLPPAPGRAAPVGGVQPLARMSARSVPQLRAQLACSVRKEILRPAVGDIALPAHFFPEHRQRQGDPLIADCPGPKGLLGLVDGGDGHLHPAPGSYSGSS